MDDAGLSSQFPVASVGVFVSTGSGSTISSPIPKHPAISMVRTKATAVNGLRMTGNARQGTSTCRCGFCVFGTPVGQLDGQLRNWPLWPSGSNWRHVEESTMLWVVACHDDFPVNPDECVVHRAGPWPLWCLDLDVAAATDVHAPREANLIGRR